MKPLPPILVVDQDPHTLQAFRAALDEERGIRLLVASGADEAHTIAAREKPGLIAAAFTALGAEALALCRSVKGAAWGRGVRFLLLLDRDAAGLRPTVLQTGVDDALIRPVDPVAVRVWVRQGIALRGLLECWEESQREVEQLRHMLDQGGGQVVSLLSSLLDMSLPGGSARGARTAALAARIAARFDVPMGLRTDLEVASRLHELGLIAMPPRARELAGEDAWQVALTTRAMLAQIDHLHGAAEVVGAMYENWDGSGRPDHLRQGQIPLRSRILRVAAAYQAAAWNAERGAREQALETFFTHSGAFYDPMVLVHLRAVLSDSVAADDTTRPVPIPVSELEPGMVLAEDLATESGILLLARNTVLTRAALEAILRRHQVEPILRGAVVQRFAA